MNTYVSWCVYLSMLIYLFNFWHMYICMYIYWCIYVYTWIPEWFFSCLSSVSICMYIYVYVLECIDVSVYTFVLYIFLNHLSSCPSVSKCFMLYVLLDMTNLHILNACFNKVTFNWNGSESTVAQLCMHGYIQQKQLQATECDYLFKLYYQCVYTKECKWFEWKTRRTRHQI